MLVHLHSQEGRASEIVDSEPWILLSLVEEEGRCGRSDDGAPDWYLVCFVGKAYCFYLRNLQRVQRGVTAYHAMGQNGFVRSGTCDSRWSATYLATCLTGKGEFVLVISVDIYMKRLLSEIWKYILRLSSAILILSNI